MRHVLFTYFQKFKKLFTKIGIAAKGIAAKGIAATGIAAIGIAAIGIATATDSPKLDFPGIISSPVYDAEDDEPGEKARGKCKKHIADQARPRLLLLFEVLELLAVEGVHGADFADVVTLRFDLAAHILVCLPLQADLFKE